ncbi:MAG TPA: response regulator, partial [Verrucomicrobiae bacterium]
MNNTIELEAELTRMEIMRNEARREANLRFGVLLADDDQNDRFMIRRELENSGCLRPVAEVKDGIEVLEYLTGVGLYEDRTLFPLPDLLVIDINMPRMNGLQVLAWLQRHNFPDLRVVMLSASLDRANIKTALELGADYYQPKTGDRAILSHLVTRLELLMVLMSRRHPRKATSKSVLAESG